MSTLLTITGVYRDGKVELSQRPEGLGENASVLVTFLPANERSEPAARRPTRRPRRRRRGSDSGPPEASRGWAAMSAARIMVGSDIRSSGPASSGDRSASIPLRRPGVVVDEGVRPTGHAVPGGGASVGLEVLYRRMPRALRGYLIAEVLEDQRKGELDLSGLWVARIRSGRIVGAMMTQALAGKTAALWPPEVGPSWRRPPWPPRWWRRRWPTCRPAAIAWSRRRWTSRPARGRPRPDPRRHAPRDRAALPRA